MIHFRFTINTSFLKYSTHPITVPKQQVKYSQLVKERLDKGDLTIIFPKGQRVCGHMYYGKSGYGPYYQIRTYSGESIPKGLSKGDSVLVIILKDKNKRYSILEFL